MLDDDFKNLKRSAIVMKPRQPFFNWLLSHDRDMAITQEIREATIYLLPDFETVGEIENWLRKNFDELFSEHLFQWYIDESFWPQVRTFTMFGEWFEYSLHTMIFDTQKGVIEKI
ncbi:MAG TPA: hypothetical protein VN451_01200 [Chitinophagaceae bacterium]|nr:hypothetical protein [Chitinophagaceae bacterium]